MGLSSGSPGDLIGVRGKVVVEGREGGIVRERKKMFTYLVNAMKQWAARRRWLGGCGNGSLLVLQLCRQSCRSVCACYFSLVVQMEESQRTEP